VADDVVRDLEVPAPECAVADGLEVTRKLIGLPLPGSTKGGTVRFFNRIPIRSTGRKLTIGPVLATPKSPSRWPSWNTHTTSPIAAAMLSRNPAAALIGTRIDRKTALLGVTDTIAGRRAAPRGSGVGSRR
jgi:hypothetical protein